MSTNITDLSDVSAAMTPDAGFLNKQDRALAFGLIRNALGRAVARSNEDAILAEGDAIALLKQLPDQSVSLILTDPPYHVTQKRNILNDTAFSSDDAYIEWISALASEWRRVLKPNGSLYCFCDPTIAYRIEHAIANSFNLLAHVVWTKPNEPGFDGWKQKMKKESLRQWYSHTERVIFAEPSFEGNLGRSYLGLLLRLKRRESGLSSHKLTEIVGAFGKVNHGGAVSNWETGRNIPSRDQYQKICDAFFATGKVSEMPAYEDIVRPFQVNSRVEFTDVWNFPSVRPYKGKHPAEKPENMLQHIVNTSSFPGDIVLDCFSGSGSTARAALGLGRRSVAIDLDPKWIEASESRIFGFPPLRLALDDAPNKKSRVTKLAVQANLLLE